MDVSAKHRAARRHGQPRPEHLPTWPEIWGDRRQFWVDGVPVPMTLMALGLALFASPLAVVLKNRDWDRGSWQLALIGIPFVSLYLFVLVPWVMRWRDVRRRRRER